MAAQTGLIHVEYGFAPAALDYLNGWLSITPGHWLLVCEYWMSANTSHGAGVRFSNGYECEGLARILEFVMPTPGLVCASPEPRPARITPDSNTIGGRQGRGRSTN